ncbi:MAG: hypothetical protein HC875_24045 [Anaerolineales bacterium]|nr:hypothetical protein [Anaerolineales bacterium]
MRANLTAGTTPIQNANLKAYLLRPDLTTETVSLYDNGQNGDPVASDGQYTYQFIPLLPGLYTAAIASSGTANSQTFGRSGVWGTTVVDGTTAGTKIFLPIIIRYIPN